MKTVQMFTKINLQNGFRGAQVKTWDFYQHLLSHTKFKPHITFHPDSQWTDYIPWSKQQVKGEQYLLEDPDYYLLKGGNDWKLFSENYSLSDRAHIICPIVNYRVLNKNHYSYELLKKPAIRICPSPALTNDLKSAGMVNGPIYFIANGIDTKKAKNIAWENKQIELLIIANKNPEVGEKLATQIKNPKQIKLLTNLLPFDNFINEMAQAKFIIHCPQTIEAHYMPGLEGMLQGAINIMPNCVGNTFYVEDKEDAFLCRYQLEDIISTFERVYSLPPEKHYNITNKAIDKARRYSLSNEKIQWHHLLNQLQ